ncbi:LysR family transcriptional regulator [Chitinibacter tainanensis]|uniref:LysR family transcriptional regulator n=1 Tax=Chitinibacter tainanensis TaxID=230667 RepID=UPI000427455A|nr:LysR family transcriptional regulator [Chitinibacter tainanensis]
MLGLNYKHLQYFWVVAKEGGISAAARKLGITAQTISGQVSLLEQDIGQSLFSQVGRNLQLTEAGRTMLHYADQIFMLGNELQQAMRPGNQLRPRLNIGVVDMIPKANVLQLLRPLLSSGVKLNFLVDGDLNELVAKLTLHQLDLVLADRPLSDLGALKLASRVLGSAQVAWQGTPARLAELSDTFPACLQHAPLLLPARNTALRLQLDVWLSEMGLAPEIVGEFSDSELMRVAAKAGMGLQPFPTLDLHDIPDDGLAKIGKIPSMRITYHAIYSPRKILPPALAKLLESPPE